MGKILWIFFISLFIFLMLAISGSHFQKNKGKTVVVVKKHGEVILFKPAQANVNYTLREAVIRHSLENASAPPSFGEASTAEEWVAKYNMVAYYDSAVSEYGEDIEAAAKETGVNQELIAATIARESRCDPSAVGGDGELSLMQIKPSTGKDFGVPKDSLMIPKWNILAGARYYAWLFKQFHGNSVEAIVAYAWGNGRIEEARACCDGDLAKEPNYQKVMAIISAANNQ